MEEPTIIEAAEEAILSFWDTHRYLLLIACTIGVALVLVITSMTIYNVSGSAQLDLSRPGYQSVSSQVDHSDTIDNYSASGPVNRTTVDQFTKLYDDQANKAKAIDAFNGDPLNPEVLEFGAGSAQ